MTGQMMVGLGFPDNKKVFHHMNWLKKLLGKYKSQEVSPYATDEKYIFQGLDLIIGGVDLRGNIKQFIYDNFPTMHRAGDPRTSKKFFIKALDGIEWSWEWYDKSEDIFNDLGAFPYMWREENGKNKKAELLCHTVTKAVYSCRDKNRNIALLKRKGLSWGDAELSDLVRLSIVTDEHEKIQQLTQIMFEDGFDNGAGEWPPYYPGDRSSVMFERTFSRYRKKTS